MKHAMRVTREVMNRVVETDTGLSIAPEWMYAYFDEPMNTEVYDLGTEAIIIYWKGETL